MPIKLFGKTTKHYSHVLDKTYLANDEAFKVIEELQDMVSLLQYDNNKLTRELDDLKPLVEDKDLKPVVSTQCERCKYGVINPFTKETLYCCKDAVCNGFEKKEVNND